MSTLPHHETELQGPPQHCRFADPEMFFVGRGSNAKAARRLCLEGPYANLGTVSPCKWRQACLLDSLTDIDSGGVRGAVSERDRRVWLRRVAPDFGRGKRRGSPVELAVEVFGSDHPFTRFVAGPAGQLLERALIAAEGQGLPVRPVATEWARQYGALAARRVLDEHRGVPRAPGAIVDGVEEWAA